MMDGRVLGRNVDKCRGDRKVVGCCIQAIGQVVITILTGVVAGGERRRVGLVQKAGQVSRPGRLQ